MEPVVIRKSAYTIKISKRVSEEKDAFKDRWPFVKTFISELFAMDGINHPKINKVEEALMELFYKGYEKEINHQLNLIFYSLFHEFLVQLSSLQPQQMIDRLLIFFRHLADVLGLLSELLQYWEKSYLSKKQDKTLKRVVLNILHNEISNQHIVEELLTENVLKWFEDFREDRVKNTNGEELTKMTLDIGMFKKSIQAQMLERSKHYYQAKRNRLPTNIDFLNLIDRQLQKEQYLMKLVNPSEDTTKIIEKQFISQNLDEMVNFLDYLINHEQRPQLKLLYNYLLMVDHVDLLERRLEQLIADTQKLLLKGKVDQVLKYKISLQKLVTECFGNKKQQLQFINSTFQSLLSQHFSICNESMSDYVIEHYRTDIVSEEAENLALQMFKISPSTDLFIALYQNKLAKEVLTHSTTNLTKHLELLANVKLHAGQGLISPIQKMLDDVWRDGHLVTYSSTKFKCKLIFKNNWPKLQGTPLNVPDALRGIRNQFEDQYLAEHPYKELTWLYNLGTCQININGVDHSFSELHASIIIYISRAIRPMKLEELITVLKIDTKEVKQATEELLSHGVIYKESHSKVYEVNFDNKKPFIRKTKYPLSQLNKLNISVDRDITTQACITRLLKREKVMQRAAVIKEVTDMIKHFKPTIEQVNNSIKKLVSIEYLKIHGNDIHYVP